jgi:prepilin-type N-terminal cleavage/methylation domain-containing protein
MIRTLRNWFRRAVVPRPVEGPRRPRYRAAGFSLIEIMVALAIVAFIGAGVAVVVNRALNNAKIKVAKERIKEISQGVTTYMIDSNNCPKGMDDLVAQKYVARASAKDPWGKDFILKCPGTNDSDGADIVSSGPDKAEGTGDDIKSWEQQ